MGASPEETIATVHCDPLSNSLRTKCRSSSFNIPTTVRTTSDTISSPDHHDGGVGVRNSVEAGFTVTHHQSDTSLHNLSHTNAPLRESVKGILDERTVTNHHSVHIIPVFTETNQRLPQVTKTSVNGNEDMNVAGHLMMMMMVQRAGSVPNETTSSDNPYETKASETGPAMTTKDQIGHVVTKRGSIVNGTGDMGSDRRRSRQIDNVTELVSRRTLNGGSSLSLTGDPRSRTCCFCWCCCCSCSW